MTMYELPYGNTQQLNLDWFIKRWQEFYTQWQETEAGIDHALDAEVQRVEDAMTDLYAARDTAAASATAAAASATSASNDATIAANAATAAEASATLANTKATAAGLSEAAAALSASQAANDATAAATSASQASASASSATDSATAAAASATAADSSADDAADSATAAAGSATAAAGSASDAADSATAAAASAASIVVDSAMSDSSTNPVQNKVINGELTELKTALSEYKDSTQIYNDIMGLGSVSTTGRKFKVNKNTVTISNVDGSTSTSYRCCSIFGTLTAYSDPWSNVDLSNATYSPINYDPSKLELYVTVKWDKLYSPAKNFLNIATKNESTGVVTKYSVSSDVNTLAKIRQYNLSAFCPLITENKNFALFVENRYAKAPNTLTYWFDLVPIDNDFHEVDAELNQKVNDYASLLVSKTSVESFMFFTDSHYLGMAKWKEYYLPMVYNKMGAVYNTAPVDFCIFGGDGIVNTSAANTITPAQAVSYLAYHDKVCRTIFGNDTYFPMIGNHDTNYEGTASITTQDLINAEFRKWGKAYYKFNGNTSTFYVLDTGMSHIGSNYNVPMDSYKWEQIDWLGNALAEDDPDHAIIALHIIRNNNTNQPKFPMFIEANELCAAFNSHTTITKNDVTYDFTNCTGRVELFLGGHLHGDSYDIFENGIPCIMRVNLQNGSATEPTYDLVLCDWTGRAVTFFRIGNGNSKTVDLDTGEEITE